MNLRVHLRYFASAVAGAALASGWWGFAVFTPEHRPEPGGPDNFVPILLGLIAASVVMLFWFGFIILHLLASNKDDV